MSVTTKTLPDLGESFEVTADITKRDIKAGVKGDCHKCPAAKAFLRALQPLGFDWAEVGTSMVSAGVNGPNDAGLFYASDWADDAIRNFVGAFDTQDITGITPGPIKITVTLRRIDS